MIDKGDTYTVTQLDTVLATLGLAGMNVQEIRINTHTMRVTTTNEHGDTTKTMYRLVL